MADLIASESLQQGDDVSFEVDESKVHAVCSDRKLVQGIAFGIKEPKKETRIVVDKESNIPR